MKHIALSLALLFASAFAAQAECYADYKAKAGPPLKLHYGVIALPDRACGNTTAAEKYINGKIRRDGWTLLTVVSVFGKGQLGGKEGRAGQYFLRY